MFDRNQIIKEAQEVFKELEQFGFGDVDMSNSTEFNRWCRMHDILLSKQYGYRFASGSTRNVIVCEKHSFVIKFQTSCYTDYNGNVCKSCQDIDYNDSEAYIYVEAEKYGLEKHFAWMFRLPDYENSRGSYSVYAMERCYVSYEDMASSAAEASGYHESRYFVNDNGEELTEDEYDELCSEDRAEFWSEYDETSEWGDYEQMRCLAQSQWGYDEEREVNEFLEKYGVNDCHAGNWGWLEGVLKLTDYAGYCRKVCEDYWDKVSAQGNKYETLTSKAPQRRNRLGCAGRINKARRQFMGHAIGIDTHYPKPLGRVGEVYGRYNRLDCKDTSCRRISYDLCHWRHTRRLRLEQGKHEAVPLAA